MNLCILQTVHPASEPQSRHTEIIQGLRTFDERGYVQKCVNILTAKLIRRR